MIVAIDTSTPVCRLWIVHEGATHAYQWESGRDLADGILRFLRERLADHDSTWDDVSALAVFKGPGSFTGLRIGLTVFNTIADSMGIPIVGETGEDWLATATDRLEAGQDDKLVMPVYGREPNITKPRK